MSTGHVRIGGRQSTNKHRGRRNPSQIQLHDLPDGAEETDPIPDDQRVENVRSLDDCDVVDQKGTATCDGSPLAHKSCLIATGKAGQNLGLFR